MSDLISRLVQEKSTQKASSPSTAKQAETRTFKMKLNWEKLAHEPLYLLEVYVRVGKQSVRLQGEDLGIDAGTLCEMEDFLRGGYSGKLSKRLKEAAGRLQSMQKQFYKQYTVYCDPFRFVHKEKLQEAEAAITEIELEADKLRQDLVKHYDEELEWFLREIDRMLTKAGIVNGRKDAAIERYYNEYPTPEDFAAEALQIKRDGPREIQPLLEHLKESSELKEAEAQRQKAELELAKTEAERDRLEQDAKLQRQQLEVIQKSQTAFAQSLAQAMGVAHAKARDEAYELIGDLLDRQGAIEPGAINQRVKQAWDTAFNRLKTLALHDQGLTDLVTRAEMIRKLYESKHTKLKVLEQQLNQFRDDLTEIVKNENSGSGASKLSKILHFEGQYKSLISDLEDLAKNPDPLKLSQIENQYQSFKALFKYREKQLQKIFAEAEESVKISQGISQPKVVEMNPNPDTEPYDKAAGF